MQQLGAVEGSNTTIKAILRRALAVTYTSKPISGWWGLAAGRRLLDVPSCTFHVVVTTLPLPPAEVWRLCGWRFHNGRADSENRLRELKDDFGANGFGLQAFDGTKTAVRFGCPRWMPCLWPNPPPTGYVRWWPAASSPGVHPSSRSPRPSSAARARGA